MSLHREKLASMFEVWDLCNRGGGGGILDPFVSKGQGFAVYGAGMMGRRVARILKREFGTEPLCFIDRDAGDIKGIDGIDVMTIGAAFGKHGDVAVGVAVLDFMRETAARDEIRAALKQGGFTRIRNIVPMDVYENDFAYMSKIDCGKALLAVDLLYDAASKDQYCAYIYQRMWKTLFFAPMYPANACYCATDLFCLGKGDHALDCGAYTGDTIRQLLDNFPNLGRITAFEPDSRAYERCRAAAAAETTKRKGLRIDVIESAVSGCSRTVSFDVSDNLTGSRLDAGLRDAKEGHAEKDVHACRIDDMGFDAPPGFIKMDIEGAELDALKGAENTIRRYRPILAVCLYHRAEDIYEIPIFVKGICPDYRLFTRKNCWNYATNDFQMFAVPPERLL